MSINRIQKLLFSEYSEFEDMVIVESPFAQTTREGKGIRQVHLGTTIKMFFYFHNKLRFSSRINANKICVGHRYLATSK